MGVKGGGGGAPEVEAEAAAEAEAEIHRILTQARNRGCMRTSRHPAPEIWIDQIFAAKAVKRGGVIRRSLKAFRVLNKHRAAMFAFDISRMLIERQRILIQIEREAL